MKQHKTILLENNGLLTPETKKWIDKIDNQYLEINSSIRDYMRSDDLWTFGMFIDPWLKTIATSSEFKNIMPYEASESFGKTKNYSDPNEKDFYQIDYYTYIMYEAVGYRKRKNLPMLTIEINYLGDDFLEDLKSERFGYDTTSFIRLMFRQNEGFVKLNIYEDYVLQTTVLTEDDLKF